MVKRNKGGKGTELGKMNKAKSTKMSNNAKSGSSKHKSGSSSNPFRPDPSGGKKGSMFRSRSTIKRLNMYTEKPDLEKMRK